MERGRREEIERGGGKKGCLYILFNLLCSCSSSCTMRLTSVLSCSIAVFSCVPCAASLPAHAKPCARMPCDDEEGTTTSHHSNRIASSLSHQHQTFLYSCTIFAPVHLFSSISHLCFQTTNIIFIVL